MKFLRKSQLNFRNVKDNSVAIQIDGEVTLDSTNVLLVPKGATNERPLSPTNGHVRYNTTVNEFEFYQNGAWRKVSYKEPTSITQQNLGNGDSEETYFGPLNSGNTDYPYPELSMPQNIIVLVENVFQLATTNYTLEDNPYTKTSQYIAFDSATKSFGLPFDNFGPGDNEETVFGPLNSNVPGHETPAALSDISVAVDDVYLIASTEYTFIDNPYRVTSGAISFDSATNTIQSNNISLVNFDIIGYRAGQLITVTGSASNNRTFTITNQTVNTLEVAETVTTEALGSTVTISSSTHPEGRYVKLTAAPAAVPVVVIYLFDINFDTIGYKAGQTITVSGTTNNNGIYTITNSSVNLITVSQDIVDETAGIAVTISDPSFVAGRYVKFDSPVPIGKPVTVLHGFDR